MNGPIKKPMVYLVGAGPGSAGLLTLRGKECLEQADFVLYDQLVSPRLLDYAPAAAEKMCVRELAGSHPDRWPHINLKLIEEANKGKCVVRLKGGDPLVFGRGGEEAEALRAVGIPYEIVPGVTAALAAGSHLEIPLTHRLVSSAVAFITGHEHPGKSFSLIDWKAIAHFPGTVVIYMGFSRLGTIVRELIHHGKDPNTPAAAVSRVSMGEQRTVTTTLDHLEESVTNEGLTTPALVLIGHVVALRPETSWFEALPLFGKRILVTRPLQQAGEMLHHLELLGAVPYLLPVVQIRDPRNWSEVDAAQDRMKQGDFDWLIFTSANGVNKFFDRLLARGNDLRALGRIKIAAIGSATASKLQEYHLAADVVSATSMDSEKLLEQLAAQTRGKRVLLARADRGRELIVEQLTLIAHVESIAVYTQSDEVDPAAEAFELLRRDEIDFVTLTSPNIARAFLAACDRTIKERLALRQIRLVSNSPRVSAVIVEQGLHVAAQSSDPTMKSLLAALVELNNHFTSR